MLEVAGAVDCRESKHGDRQLDVRERRLEAELVVVGVEDAFPQRRVFVQRDGIGRTGLAAPESGVGAIDVAAREDDRAPGNAGKRGDPLRVAGASGKHVDHDLGLERSQGFDVTVEVGEVSVHVLGRELELVLAAVEQEQLVTGGRELANEKRADETSSTQHENSHRRLQI